jgi:uncharacterized membrane protein YdfJ with MMPL/SSD domain
MKWLGAFAHRRRRTILLVAGLWFSVAIGLLVHGGRLSTGAIHGLEAERAAQLAEAVVGRSTETTFVAVFESAGVDGLDPGGAAFAQEMQRALAPLAGDPRVTSVTTPANAGPLLGPRMVDARAHAAFALVSLAGDVGDAAASYRALRGLLRSDTLTITCTGHVAFMRDLDRILEHDLVRAEAISLPVCLALLCAVFGSLVAAALPVCVGALAVVSGIAVVTVLSRWMELAQYTVNVCSLIGLGVAIDYSLFIVSRYREELAAGRDYREALSRSLETAGRVVLFSGFAVTSGLAGLLFFPRSYLLAMGLGGAIVVGFAVLAALTVLPALLAALGPWIHRGKLPRIAMPVRPGFWHRTAERVMRHPVLVLVPVLGVLLTMGTPFLRLRMMASDVRVLPAEAEARAGYELLRRDFPGEAGNHIALAVAFPAAPALDAGRVVALYDLAQRARRLPSVTRVDGIIDPEQPVPREAWPGLLLSPPPELAMRTALVERLSVGDRTVLFDVVTDQVPESLEARSIVRALRADRRVADGTLLVGGQTANDLDTTAYVLERAPRVVAFVVAVTYVVLFLLLGSVLLPIKAVLMNFLSIAGSFGALVWIFQEGHGLVQSPRPVEPSLPVLLFCTLFGLSMDYEVLMLTRMKEAYDRTGDDRACVAEGLEKSAGLITSAAAIMVAVFSAFAFARIVLIQAVGFGMALAVALDATLVRVLVVPATMRLMGHLNWWAPRSMARIARSVGLGERH